MKYYIKKKINYYTYTLIVSLTYLLKRTKTKIKSIDNEVK